LYQDKWTYPPFSAHMDEQGNIYARGSQDTKCVGIQYLEAIRRLKLNGQRCRRTIHVSFVPDEDMGGILGMRYFVHTTDFKVLNVGFVLGEGFASPFKTFSAFYGERSIWHVVIKCVGNPGHASVMMSDTAGEKLRVIIDRFMDFRASEIAKFSTDPTKMLATFSKITCVNLMKVWVGIMQCFRYKILWKRYLSISLYLKIKKNQHRLFFFHLLLYWIYESKYQML